MNKPITVNIKDTANKIRSILDESQLHPLITVQIAQEIYTNEINKLNLTAEREEQEYYNQLKKEGENNAK